MPRKVALLIGVSEYGEGIPSLSAPRNDVTEMKQVLENPKMGGFDDVKILPDPDLAEMQKAVQQIFASRSKDDLVLLFFSGHGITDDNNKLYFATKGTSKDFYKATSVPASFIQDISLECYAKRQVMILDCCFSGAFAEGWIPKSLELELERELGAEGRVVLTSSTAFQKSFQREDGEFSLYTQYILEGIETGAADKNSDGKIFAQELHEYAKAKVKEAKPKQEPGILIDREGFNILISQAPINDPELSFRQLVEKYTFEDRVSVTGKYILQVKQQELGITDQRAQEIIDEVLAPYRKRMENIGIYREAFTENVKYHYPLTAKILSELQDLQDILGLEDKDISKVKKEVLAEKELEDQEPKETSQSSQMTAEEFLNSGLDKREKGDNRGAIEDYNKAIELKPDDADAYNNRGNAYKALKEYQKAIADYTKAIELKPDYATAYNNRGSAYDDLKDYQKAIADYTKAIELNPDYADVYYNRAISHKNLKDYQSAIKDYQKAADLDQKQGKTDDYQDAIKQIKKLEK